MDRDNSFNTEADIRSNETQNNYFEPDWSILSDDTIDSASALSAHLAEKATARRRRDDAQKHAQTPDYFTETPQDKPHKTHPQAPTTRQILEEAMEDKKQIGEGVDTVFAFLGEGLKQPNREAVERYYSTTDPKTRLKILAKSSTKDQWAILSDSRAPYAQLDNFNRAMCFQRDILSGKATARNADGYWHYGENTYLAGQKPIRDMEEIMPDRMKAGLTRAAMRAAMIGTPEYGAYKMAQLILETKNEGKDYYDDDYTPMHPDFPVISGVHSGIDSNDWRYGGERNPIGGWKPIIDEYAKIRDSIAHQNPDATPEEIEHKAVRRAAHLYVEAGNYPHRGLASPYTSSFSEAVAWAQLGEGAKRQFAGMREKICGIDLHNIERFIGKSGDSEKLRSYRREKHFLEEELERVKDDIHTGAKKVAELQHALLQPGELDRRAQRLQDSLDRLDEKYAWTESPDADPEAVSRAVRGKESERTRFEAELQEIQTNPMRYRSRLINRSKEENMRHSAFLDELNQREVTKQDTYQERETTRINHKYDKLIAKTRSPERRATYEDWRQQELLGLQTDCDKKRNYYSTRILGDAQRDIQKRLKLVDSRIAKRKSLAEKAVDLYFACYKQDKELGLTDEWNYEPIDWINSAPFGDIARCHRELSREQFSLDKLAEKLVESVSHDSKTHLLDNHKFSSFEINSLMTLKRIGFSTDDAEYLDYAISEIGKKEAKKALEEYGAEWMRQLLTGPNGLDVSTAYYTVNLLRNSSSDNDDALKSLSLVQWAYDTHSWLIRDPGNEGENIRSFPYEASRPTKELWCAKHSVSPLAGGWNQQTLGKLIYTRLETNIDSSMHDATYWLRDFDYPHDDNGGFVPNIKAIKRAIQDGQSPINLEEYQMQVSAPRVESQLLSELFRVPISTRDKVRLSSKPQKVQQLFSEPVNQFIYSLLAKTYNTDMSCQEAISSWKEDGKFNELLENFYASVCGNNKDGSHYSDIDEFHKEVNRRLKAITSEANPEDSQDASSPRTISLSLQELSRIGLNRKQYIDDTTSWLLKHATAPREQLVTAWASRADALADGYDDSISSTLQWTALNKLHSKVNTHIEDIMKAGLTPKDILNSTFSAELSRCYGIQKIIKGISIEKKSNLETQEKLMPASRRELSLSGETFYGEILPANDPRGMTIGYDTGCCMTLGGASESCIKSGYRDPNAGFFALYEKNGRLMAQSYFYVNPENPDVVVMDNIEANQGRSAEKLVELYRQFFDGYLRDHSEADPNWQVKQVNVGTQYGELVKPIVKLLEPAKIIRNPDKKVYTDAKYDQRLLLRIS